MICDWKEAYQLEAQFAKILVKQKEKGFLVNKELITTHIGTLTGYIEGIDKETIPKLPKRIIIQEQKKQGEYGYLKKPFKGNGEYSKYCLDYINVCYPDSPDTVSGPFARVEFSDFDLGSLKSVKEYLLSVGWVPELWNYSKEDKKKRTSPKLSQEDPFLGVKGNLGKLIAKRVVYRHRRSQLEGFIKLVREDGRITADVTGLCPTARIKHKGIVNVPSGDSVFGNEMREVFVAPEGYVIVGCDAASCQLRMLCHYMGDRTYTEAVVFGKKEEGTDIHSVNMRIAGLKERSDAKTLIYAILFGAGDEKLATQLNVSRKEAKKIRERFIQGLPKLKDLVDNLKRVWKDRGYLIGLDGRKIYVRSDHMLLVYLLQSAEAIMMKVATCYAYRYLNSRFIDAGMVAHVHDEMQWEVAEESSEEVGELLAESIVKAGEYLNLTVPMAGEYCIGNNWKETH